MQKTIEITTTQNVTIEYELALLRERVLAWLLDIVLVGLGDIVLFVLLLQFFVRNADPTSFYLLLPSLCYYF